MSCCGNKRASLALPETKLPTPTSRRFAAGHPVAETRSAAPAPTLARPAAARLAPASPSPGAGPGTVRLRYLARAPILVRGARSGAAYRFSEARPVIAVQRVDAEPLLATGHFRREG